jgi:hypothetical protein
MLEVTEMGQPLLASLPGKDALLPSEKEFLDHYDYERLEQMPSHLVCTPLVVEIGPFARTAQATMFVHSIHQAFGICDTTIRTDRLNSISTEIQSFLGIMISQSDGKPAVYCGALSIAIRLV